MSSQPRDNDRNPSAEANNKGDSVRGDSVTGGKRPVDLIVFGFLGLAAISGGFLGVFSLLGYWQNKETWGIWALYCLIIFTVTAGFLTWQKRIWERPPVAAPQPDKRAYVFIKYSWLEKLTEGENAVIQLVFQNNGQSEAQIRIWNNTYRFVAEPPFDKGLRFLPSETLNFSLAPNAEVRGRLISTFIPTEGHIEDLINGKARLYFFARGEYKDETGRAYPLPFCRMWNKSVDGNLVFCPDLKISDTSEAPKHNNTQ